MRIIITRPLVSSFILSLLCVSFAVAQERNVTGVMSDEATGNLLPGVNIQVQGTTTGTTTDEGNYSLTVPDPDAVLVFSFAGYQHQEIRVGDRTTIDVQLQEDVARIDELVVGYGTLERREITGSVSPVDIEKANAGQQASPQDLIRGRVSGLSVLDNSDEPGTGVSIIIRGTSSMSAGTEPLYVVDGVPINNTSVALSGGGARFTMASSSNPLALLNP